jgi:hypothetical protein
VLVVGVGLAASRAVAHGGAARRRARDDAGRRGGVVGVGGVVVGVGGAVRVGGGERELARARAREERGADELRAAQLARGRDRRAVAARLRGRLQPARARRQQRAQLRGAQRAGGGALIREREQ